MLKMLKHRMNLERSKGSNCSSSRGHRMLCTPFNLLAANSLVLNFAMKLSSLELNWNVSKRSKTSMALQHLRNGSEKFHKPLKQTAYWYLALTRASHSLLGSNLSFDLYIWTIFWASLENPSNKVWIYNHSSIHGFKSCQVEKLSGTNSYIILC